MPNDGDMELIKMSELARRSEVPAATIKHYIREGLLPPPAKRTSRNMAYYDAALVTRIKKIKELQHDRFLPLKVIKEVLDRTPEDASNFRIAQVIARVLGDSERSKTAAELKEAGVTPRDLKWLRRMGLAAPMAGEGDDAEYRGDELELVEVLAESRALGLTTEMLPASILMSYVQAIQQLVRVELQLFRQGVIPLAGDDIEGLTETATRLSERLVVLLRRRMLLPTLEQLVKEESGDS